MKEKTNWLEVGSKNTSLNERQEAGLYCEINHADEERSEDLKSLAQEIDCKSLFRKAAIWRMTDLAKENPDLNITTSDILHEISVDQDEDEDVRAGAYKCYRHLRCLSNGPMTQEDLKTEREKAKDDPSPRMRWLRSLSD